MSTGPAVSLLHLLYLYVELGDQLVHITGPAVSLLVALQLVQLASSPSTSGASPTRNAPPSMGTPNPGVPPRLTPTVTTSQESVLGDTVMPIALALTLGIYLLSKSPHHLPRFFHFQFKVKSLQCDIRPCIRIHLHLPLQLQRRLLLRLCHHRR